MREHLEGWAFVATALVIVILFVTLFLNLYPRVLVSSVNPKFSLTLSQAASQPYTLKVMSWVRSSSLRSYSSIRVGLLDLS